MPAQPEGHIPEQAAFRPVRPVRAYQRVAEQIEERILGGDLPPGSRLPGERELMRQFDVGRSTVREALRVLQSSGLVRSRPGDPQGAEVLGVSPDTLSHALGRLARSHLSGLGELIQFRMLLDAESYRLAARLHTEDDLKRLTGLVDRMEEGVPAGPHGFSEADAAFHRVVAEASGNALLALCARAVHDAVVDAIESKLARAQHTGEAVEAMRRSVAHHRQILTALRARDGARAARLGREALHDHFAPHLPPRDRLRLRAALETSRPWTATWGELLAALDSLAPGDMVCFGTGPVTPDEHCLVTAGDASADGAGTGVGTGADDSADAGVDGGVPAEAAARGWHRCLLKGQIEDVVSDLRRQRGHPPDQQLTLRGIAHYAAHGTFLRTGAAGGRADTEDP